MKMKTQNLWDSVKAVLRGGFIAIQAYLKKQEGNQINNLTLHLKQLEKEEIKNPRVSRRKEILKIRAAAAAAAAVSLQLCLTNALSILFIFSKNQLLALLIFAMVSFAFISALIFKISFLLLILGWKFWPQQSEQKKK